jgi:hypothetical protein
MLQIDSFLEGVETPGNIIGDFLPRPEGRGKSIERRGKGIERCGKSAKDMART